MSGDIAAVGAPNTDSVESGDNAGAVFAADINWVTLGFEVQILCGGGFLGGCRPSEEKWRRHRDDSAPERPHPSSSGPLLATPTKQHKSGSRTYGLWGDRARAGIKTAAEVVGAGKAHARASWYGGTSNSSRWVDGGRDDTGASDLSLSAHEGN